MPDATPVRSIWSAVLSVVAVALIAVAIALTARVVVLFFGTLAAQGWAEAIVTITDRFVIPFGIEPIKTPYGGIFDVDASLTIVVVVVGEWLLSLARGRG